MSVPRIRLETVEAIARKILMEYDSSLLSGEPRPIPIEAMIRSELQRARAENTKANKEYESLKAEVLKAIQGKSALPQDVLSEMLEDARQKVLPVLAR